MKWNFEGVCPICAKMFPCAQLHAHVVAEKPAIRREIMLLIQAQRPDWTYVQGICQSCWDSYRLSYQAADAR